MDQHEARSRNILACLGDTSRFRLVLSLLECERCVTELAGEVGLSQSCTTRHLQYLEREGLVRGDRQGKRVVFRLRSDQARVRELLEWVTASAPDPGAGKLSGGDLHADGPGRNEKKRARPEGPAPGGEPPPKAAISPPAETADNRRAVAPSAPSGSDSDPGGPRGGTDMEDWLL